jgi:hypothetical protein
MGFCMMLLPCITSICGEGMPPAWPAADRPICTASDLLVVQHGVYHFAFGTVGYPHLWPQDTVHTRSFPGETNVSSTATPQPHGATKVLFGAGSRMGPQQQHGTGTES